MRKAELPALTGIRFYAALVVFLYHVPSFVPGMKTYGDRSVLFNSGDVGVSFFFVLSGFILTYNYANTFRERVGTASYTRFLWDRLTKIYPVHLLTLLIVLPIAIFHPQRPLDWRALPFHLLLLQCFWPSPTPAFSDYLNKPSWSISCEWFFYLLAPVAMLFVLGKSRRWVPVVVAVAYAFGLGLFLYNGQSDSTRLYFVSRFAPSRFMEFLVGIFLARLFLTSSGRRLAGLSGVVTGAGIVLIVAGAVYAPYAPWPLLGGGLLYVPGSALLILGLADGGGFPATHLSRPLLKRLGTASFSFYMIHEPLIRGVKGACLFLGWAVHSWAAFAAVMIAMFVVTQAAAFLICFCYEIPLQKRFRMVDMSQFPRDPAWSRPTSAG